MRGQQLAVVVIQHFVSDAQAAPGFLRFGAAALGQFAASHALVAGVAIGDGNKFHGGAQCAEPCRSARGADVAIVGMRAKSDDAQGASAGPSKRGRGRKSSKQAERSRSDIPELVLPDRFALLINRRAAKIANSVLMAERSATFSTSPFWMRVRKASMASFVMSRLEAMVSASFTLVVNHAGAGGFDHALGAR